MNIIWYSVLGLTVVGAAGTALATYAVFKWLEGTDYEFGEFDVA